MPELLHGWVTTQAERRPEASAVVLRDQKLTYGELDALSNQLARALKEGGCRRGDRICLLMPKSPMAIVGILGIYKADCVYVPLDPSSPAQRLSKIVNACANRWILAAGPVGGLLTELLEEERLRGSVAVAWMDKDSSADGSVGAEFTLGDILNYPKSPPQYQNRRRDAGHILFTSGSTGVPKGVVITHANVIAFIEWAARYFEINMSDRVSGHPPLHFDLSFFDIFGAFAAGAELHLVPPEVNLLPNKLADWMRSSQLTQWFSVPSALNYMAKFNVVRFNDFPSLRRLMWCGEVFPTPSLIYWMKRLPHATFTNLYGPTETTIASSYHTVSGCPDDERAVIPIGKACGGEELLVLDEVMRPARRGEIGDLHVRGAGLSPGYWRDLEKTREVFLRNPDSGDPEDRIYKTGDLAYVGDDGLVYFVGRSDSQIKSRGYRIELGEIEAALSTVDFLKECAVVAIPTRDFSGAMICCAYVPSEDRGVTPVMLRRELARRLPDYMVPSHWMAYGELPKNANGKVDRRRLKEAWQGDGTEAHRHA